MRTSSDEGSQQAELGELASEYGAGVANPAPMALGALELLGASLTQRRAFAAAFLAANMVAPLGGRTAPVVDWEACLGRRDREADLRDFFAGEVARVGIPGAVERYLPRLAPGVAGGDFQPLTRLAYAVLRGDRAETARSLAFWSAAYLDMPAVAGVAPRTSEPAEVLGLVAREPSLRVLPVRYPLWQTVRQMGRAPAFAPVAGWLRIDGHTIRRMAHDVLALYAASGDLCALRAVVGVHAIRVVAGVDSPARPVLLRAFWQGIAALAGAMGWPQSPRRTDLPEQRMIGGLPGWKEILFTAREASDADQISLVYSAFAECQEYGGDLYRFAAAGALGLVEPHWTSSGQARGQAEPPLRASS